jgi:flagellar biosynthesis protein FlhG
LDHGGHTHVGPSPSGSVVDVLAGRRSVHEVLERGPSGIQLLGGAWAAGEASEFSAAAQTRFISELAHLAPHAEVVVIDAGSSRGPLARRLWQAASAVLVATTTDDAAVMQAYAAIKVLSGSDLAAPIYTLVNRVVEAAAAEDVQGRIAEACRRFLSVRPIGGCGVGACEAAGAEPVLIFPPRLEAARALDRLSDTLWAQLQTGAAPQGRRATA